MRVRQRTAGPVIVVAAALPLILSSCTSRTESKSAQQAPPPPPTLTVTPAADARDVPLSAEVGLAVAGGKITAVTLSDSKGAAVDGAMRDDGTSWIPNRPLNPKQAYSVQVTAANDTGQTSTWSSAFTTMAKPTKLQQSTLYFQNNMTYGVAMPVTVAFDPGIPKESRADVQKRLFVTTDPPQPGAWHWDESGRQVYYRAPDFWKTGTKISVRSALTGVPMGKNGHGDADRTASATVGDHVTMEIDNATKEMSVFKDNQLVKKIPVSMGKPSTPTSSGKMVIMEKFETTVFDTRGDPNGGYVVQVNDAQRLTWGGEFIHAAPWSVGDQGERNVSHGCTNVSNANADWLMKNTNVGDLVTIKGTEVTLDPGNGWTAWNMTWDEYVKGSALPVPPDLRPAGEQAANPGAPVAGAPPAGPPTPAAPATPTPAGAGD
ncbi:Ig-like domain-containing protein [Polymorphospora lycopeni]|uniref:L,D-transpeptidase n=1 Tax=Polymorphospora TaxID=338583 RepID=UPI0035D49D79